MVQIDIIILSNCVSPKIYEMNLNCLDSLFQSETEFSFNVLIFESYKAFYEENTPYINYPNVQVVIPNEPFHFNKFLNKGINQTKNEIIAFCNNDIIFHKGWFSEIYKAAQTTNALSFCPKDPNSKWTANKEFNRIKQGYRIRKEFVGWCYVVKRKIFDIISMHDEQFDFYFQDDDFALTLRKFNIPHYIIPTSHVVHLGGETSSITDGFGYNEKAAKDRKVFHQKWGSQRSIAWKNRIADYLIRPLHLTPLLKYIY